jgi:hypothetical protein
MEVEIGWIVIQIAQDNPTLIMSAFGPFTDKRNAFEFSDRFNKEHDGTSWCTIVRPISEPVQAAV